MRIKKRKVSAKSPAVFLDRDGVITHAIVREGKPYAPTQLSEFQILSGVAEACKSLKAAGYMLVVATNQPDVGRGILEQGVVEEMHTLLLKELPLDRIEVCYHPGRGQSACVCRKPLPGMLLRAAGELSLDLSQSFMVGDRYGDIQCGEAAGCRTMLIGAGYGEDSTIVPDFYADNLVSATALILRQENP